VNLVAELVREYRSRRIGIILRTAQHRIHKSDSAREEMEIESEIEAYA
jgi:hypothetical protein